MERLVVRRAAEEERGLEILQLRARLRELESLVAAIEPEEQEQEQEGLERDLAMLTAQFEKSGGEEQEQDVGRSRSRSSPHPVPPAMEHLNNSARVEESVRLARWQTTLTYFTLKLDWEHFVDMSGSCAPGETSWRDWFRRTSSLPLVTSYLERPGGRAGVRRPTCR